MKENKASCVSITKKQKKQNIYSVEIITFFLFYIFYNLIVRNEEFEHKMF